MEVCYFKRGHDKGITYYYLIMASFIGALSFTFIGSPGKKGHVTGVALTTALAIMETRKPSDVLEKEEKVGSTD